MPAKRKAKPAKPARTKPKAKPKPKRPRSPRTARPDPPAVLAETGDDRSPETEPGKPGPRLEPEQRQVLVMLLAAGQLERTVLDFWESVYGERLASSTLSYWRTKCRAEIEARKLDRLERALTSGLALKAERIAALKDHAAQLEVLKWVPTKNGRLYNELAWRNTLEDIAVEMGDRKPKDGQQAELPIKVYVGIDPDKV